MSMYNLRKWIFMYKFKIKLVHISLIYLHVVVNFRFKITKSFLLESDCIKLLLHGHLLTCRESEASDETLCCKF